MPNSNIRRILIVEEDPVRRNFLKKLMKEEGLSSTGARYISDAEVVVSNYLKLGKTFDFVILGLGTDADTTGLSSGRRKYMKHIGVFGRRLVDIIGTKVIIYTSLPLLVAKLPYQLEAVIKRDDDRDAIVEAKNKILSTMSMDSCFQDSTLNRWQATRFLEGVNNIEFLSSVESYDGVEKIISKSTIDGYEIPSAIYPSSQSVNVLKLSISTLIGCPSGCLFCINHHKKNKRGKKVKYIRPLAVGEMVGQMYVAMQCLKMQKLFEKKDQMELTVNMASEGDGLVYNLDNCCEAIRQMSLGDDLKKSFIITSTGDVKSLMDYIEKYINLPNVRHHWSVNSLVDSIRKILMPGRPTRKMELMRDLYEIIAYKTKRPVTASIIVIKGVTDTEDDARRIAEFFNDRPFEIKLMALTKDSLRGIENTTEKDVENFLKKLLAAGVNIPIRIRKIWGSSILSGCGNCIATDDADMSAILLHRSATRKRVRKTKK